MKIHPVLVAVVLSVSTLAFAADETAPPLETVGLAEELLTVLRVEDSMKDSMAQVTKMQERITGVLPPEMKAKKETAVASVLGGQMMDWNRIKPMFVEIYATTFTAEELRGMIEFFKSPVGQKWIEKQPEVQQKTMQKMQELILQSQPKMIEDLMKMFKDEGPKSVE